MRRRIGLIAAGLLAAGLLAASYFADTATGGAQLYDRLVAFLQPRSAIGGAFELVDARGNPFTNRNLLGRPAVIAFGFTNCPDICPTTLHDISTWQAELGSEAERLRFVFVTVDPERDTPEILSDYLTAFDPRIIGLTGDSSALAGMRAAYGVYASRVSLNDGSYTMDHATPIYLFDSRGHFVEIITFGEATGSALAKLRKLIAASRSAAGDGAG